MKFDARKWIKDMLKQNASFAFLKYMWDEDGGWMFECHGLETKDTKYGYTFADSWLSDEVEPLTFDEFKILFFDLLINAK